MNRKDKIISAAVIGGAFGLGLFVPAANAAAVPFVAADSNGAFATKTVVTNGEVVAHDGVAHTVVNATTNAYGVTTFHLTNPLTGSGILVFIPVS